MHAASQAPLKSCLGTILACALLLMPLQAWASGVKARQEYYNRNYEAALRLAQPAAEEGDDVAMQVLGLLYYNGKTVHQNFKEAFKWWRASADKGNCRSQSNLAHLFRIGAGVAINFEEAAKWHQRSADQNCPSGYRGLGEMYEKGQHFAKDNVKALELYRKSEVLFKEELSNGLYDVDFLQSNIRFVTYKIKNLVQPANTP